MTPGRLAASIVMCLVAVGATVRSRAGAADNSDVMLWIVDGETRKAIVHAPTAPNEGGKAPLVLVFHGHGDNMQNAQHMLMHRAWPEAIVAYFQGMPSDRDELPGWQVEKGDDHDRDLKLVDAALVSIRGKMSVDDSRTYAMGFSNGAAFTYLLWAERPQAFAAFAAVAGRPRPSVKPTVPRPMFQIVGVKDPGMRAKDQQAALETSKDANGSTGQETSCGTGCTVYGGVAPVIAWLHPGGHVYPPKTSELVVTFFKNNALRR